jgi:hypothetical protein
MLRSNLPIQRVFSSLASGVKHLNRHYDNMIQNGAQYAANKLGEWASNARSDIMRRGEEYYRNLRNHYNQSNMSTNYFRLRQLSGEMTLDRDLQRINELHQRGHETIRRTQNYLISDQFKQNAIVTAGVLGTAGLMATSD